MGVLLAFRELDVWTPLPPLPAEPPLPMKPMQPPEVHFEMPAMPVDVAPMHFEWAPDRLGTPRPCCLAWLDAQTLVVGGADLELWRAV